MKGITLPKIVLIADDDEDTRVLVGNTISMMGLTTILAEDGETALEACQETMPDLAILDMMMPGMNGSEVCEHIKKSKGGLSVPVLILTARDSLQDKVDALEEGADDYLTKPFHYQELQARVKALLRVRELNVTLQEKNQQLEEMQQKLVEQERQLAVDQLAGTAAHQLGQPLAAMLLYCNLLKTLSPDDPKFKTAINGLDADAKRMAELIEKLKLADAKKTEGYYGKVNILDIEEKG